MYKTDDVPVSIKDQERIRKLNSTIARAQDETAKILSPYLGGYPFKVVSRGQEGASDTLSISSDSEVIFINDGHGHCGVYEDPPGVCRPIQCDPVILPQ